MGMGEQLDTLHLVNFLDAIRGKVRLTAPIAEGHRSTLIAQLGNLAYRTGETLKVDPSSGHILNSPEAAKLWGREYEKGWEMVV
jgi:hypothetical protein